MKSSSKITVVIAVLFIAVIAIFGFVAVGGARIGPLVPTNVSTSSSSSTLLSSSVSSTTGASSSSSAVSTSSLSTSGQSTTRSGQSSSSSSSSGGTNPTTSTTTTSSSTTSSTLSVKGPAIIVNATYTNGSLLEGMFVTLQQNGNILATGHTPVAFTVAPNENYSVTVADYKNAFFNHWGDCTSTRAHPFTATPNIVRLTAMYTSTLQPPPQCGNPADSVTVNSAYLNGTSLTGEYVNLRLNGNILIGGYTPITFSGLTAGLKYEVVVYWFGNTWFRHFSDGSLNRYYFVTPGGSPTNLTALYQYVPRSQIATLNVLAELGNGTVIGGDSVVNGSIVAKPGMWMTIGFAGQNASLTGGYTSSSMTPFYLMKGQNYTVVMSTSYGPYSFSHWKDNNSTNPVRSFFLTENDTNNVAVYVKNGTATSISTPSGIVLQPAPHQGKIDSLQAVDFASSTSVTARFCVPSGRA